MKQVDGDIALLVFFSLVGLIPVGADVSLGRTLGAESTLGLIVVGASLLGLYQRSLLLLRARALRRALLTGEH